MQEKFKSGPLRREPDSPNYEIAFQELKKAPPRVPRELHRPPVSPEMKEKMDQELMALGALMKDCGVWWQLDGALNISLYKGKYIGVHKDVDVSILQKDFEKLEKHLREHGYGLFLMKENEKLNTKTFQRVAAKSFHRKPGWKRRFAAIDEQGNIRHDANLPIIAVSAIGLDERDRPIGIMGVPFPKKWLHGETVDFHGVPINLSHPARFLFNKIWFWDSRPYDEGDLRELARSRALSLDDVREVEKTMTPILEKLASAPENSLLGRGKGGKEEADQWRGFIRQVAGWVREAENARRYR